MWVEIYSIYHTASLSVKDLVRGLTGAVTVCSVKRCAKDRLAGKREAFIPREGAQYI